MIITPLNRAAVDPALFPHWDAHPLAGDFAHALYPTVAPAHQDCSFQVGTDSEPLLLARCTILPDDKVSFYGLPLVLALRNGLSAKDSKKALNAALDHLVTLGQQHNAPIALIGGAVSDVPDLLGQLCVDRLAQGQVKAGIVADLTQDATLLKRDIRDSYRSLLNWGERNITLKAVNAANADRALFDLFPAFHAQVAGKARSDEYWQVYWQTIVAGRAELLLGWLEDGTLVSGSIVVGAGDVAYYASGVYARDQFDKPLGHWPLWSAMLRAQDQGYAWFDAGEIADHWHANAKEANIAFFKRGFSSRRFLRMQWQLPLF